MTRLRMLLAAAVVLAACRDDPAAVEPPVPMPVITAATATPGPYNVLSALVAVRTAEADSVAVRYRFAGTAGAGEGVTPSLRLDGDSATVPVLGLFAGSRYALFAVAYGPGGVTVGDSLLFITDTLPGDLPHYTAGGIDPSPGFVVFAAPPPSRYAVVIDNTGRVVWYRRFPVGPGLNFQVQPTGHYAVRPPTPDPSDREPWLELDALGGVTRVLGCANGLQPRFHDLIVEDDESYWIMCDKTLTMDLTSVGGVAGARVTGTVIQHVDASGSLLFQWSSFEHFAITDLDSASRAGSMVNWTHGNALDFDSDGNLLVSFRSLNEITKIDTRTGGVRWRLGGARSGFTFAGTPPPPFASQHGLRVVAPGEVVVLDNLGDATASRLERYALDEGRRVARQIASYGSDPAVVAYLGGATQPLPGGRVLVAYGNGGRVEEYDVTGRVVWRIEGSPGYIFRAQRVRSLYRPGVGMPR